MLVANPTTILADGSAQSSVYAQALDSLGAPVAVGTAITVSLTDSNPSCCTLVSSSTTIPVGSSDSSAAPATVQSTTSAGSASIGGTASDGTNSYPVTAVTVTTTANSITLPAQVLVAPSATANFSITLSPAAPAGGVTVNLTTLNPAVATTTSSVVIAAGQTSGTGTLTGVANGQTTLVASATGYATTSTLAVVEVITIGFTPSSTVGVPATRSDSSTSILLSAAAPPGGLVVNLASNNTGFATVLPASVIVPAGQLTSPAFTVTGVAQGSTTISASASGATGGTLNVNVGAAPAISLGSNSPIGAGLYRLFSLSLNAPADPGGTVVSLSSSDPTQLTVPATVTVPAGSYSANYQVNGISPTSTTPVTITASASGWAGSTTTESVAIPTFYFSSVPASQTTLSAPTNFYVYTNTPGCGIYCDYYSSATSISFAVNSQTPSIVTVGTPVAATPGTYYTTATLSTPTAPGTYTITASATGFTSATSGTTTVTQPTLTLAGNSPIGAGLYRSFSFNLSDPAPAGGLVVSLSSSDTSVLTVPTTVTVPSGNTTGYYQANGISPSVAGPVTITASATGWSGSTTTETVNAPTFYFSSVPSSQTTLSAPATFYVYTNTPGCGIYCDYFSTSTPVTFTINSTTAGIQTVTSPVSATPGTYYLTATLGTPAAAGTYTITASASGFTSATSGSVTVTQPTITLGSNSPIGAGLYRNFSFSLSDPAPAGGLVVSLTSSDPTLLTVPATVTVLAGNASGVYQANGIAPTSTAPVTITASATGWGGSTTTETVNTPTFYFSSVPSSQTTLSAPATIYAYTNTPGCGIYCDYFSSATSVTFTVNSATAGIVTVASPVSASPGTYYLTTTLGTPTAPGSYTITASATGFTSATSTTTTVTQPTITMNNNSPIGAGLYRNFSVYLSDPAPAGGLVVNLASTDPTILTVPSTVTVPASSTSASFQANGVTPGTVSINATAPGWAGATTTETVATPTFYFSSVPTSQTTLSAPATIYVYTNTPGCGIYCDYFSTSSSITFTINSATAGIETITSPVAATPGTYYAQTTLGTPAASGSYTITASATGFTSATSSTVTVTPPIITVNSAAPVGAGMYRTNGFSISLSDPAPAGGLTISLSSSNTGVATVQPSLVIGAGFTSGSYTITGVSAGTSNITASAAGWTSGVQAMTVNTPTFGFSNLVTSRTTADAPNTISVYASTPGCGACDVMVSGVTVTLGIVGSPSNIVTVSPTTVTIAAGSDTSGTADVGTPTTTGTYNVTASASGFSLGTSSAVTVPS